MKYCELTAAVVFAALTASSYVFADDGSIEDVGDEETVEQDSGDNAIADSDDALANWDVPIDEDDMYESEVVGYRLRPTDEANRS